jgi:hypothetical protein
MRKIAMSKARTPDTGAPKRANSLRRADDLEREDQSIKLKLN